MSFTWYSQDEPEKVPLRFKNWIRILCKGLPVVLVMITGFVLLLCLRLIERPVCGQRRPVSPYVTQGVCRLILMLLGIRYETRGQPMNKPGGMVANHASWLDIFTLNAGARVYFVSKSEVAVWPVIGVLARAVGTVFIARDPKQVKAQNEVFKSRLLSGHKLLFFPEGTSTDGLRVLPFKSTLFQAFFADNLREKTYIQPVTVTYYAPDGQDDRFYGWWGDMDFGGHMLRVMGSASRGSAKVVYHQPVEVSNFSGRKDLAQHVGRIVLSGMPENRQLSE